MRAPPLVSFASAFAVAASFALPASAEDCVPACRPGYLCHQAVCISACNPACEDGTLCSPAGQCVSPCNPPCATGETCSSSRTCERPQAAATPAAPPETKPAESNASAHFTAALGGISIPETATAGAAQAGLVLASRGWRKDTRLLVNVHHVVTDRSKTTGAMFTANNNYWFGVYGLGYGAGIGYASAERSGETQGTLSIAPYLVPVQLGFGRSTRVEIALTAGAIRFFAIDEISPWGYVSLGLVL